MIPLKTTNEIPYGNLFCTLGKKFILIMASGYNPGIMIMNSRDPLEILNIFVCTDMCVLTLDILYKILRHSFRDQQS